MSPSIESNALTALGVYIFAGGFTVGVKRAGFQVLAHLEGNGYGASSAKLNWPELPIYVGHTTWPLSEFAGRVDFLYANPPCAIFSKMGIITTRGKDAWRDDPRTDCWHQTFHAVEVVRPRAFAIESVCQAYTTGRELIDELTKKALLLGYSVTHLFVNARWHGLPQSRNRFFLVGHRPVRLAGLSLNWAPPPTVNEVLVEVREPGHISPASTKSTIDYIGLAAKTPEGGRLADTFNEVMGKLEGAPSTPTKRGGVKGRPSFNYKRLRANTQCGSFTGNWWFHPVEIRWLGINEMKAICGYSMDFQLAGPANGHASLLARAVMPPVAEFLARAIAETLYVSDGAWEDRTVFRVDRREPERLDVNLTREYLDERGRVKFKTRAVMKPIDTELVSTKLESSIEQIKVEKPSVSELSTASGPTPEPGEGSGKFIQRLWMLGRYSPEELVALVHQNYPGRKTTIADVQYNFHVLRRAGRT